MKIGIPIMLTVDVGNRSEAMEIRKDMLQLIRTTLHHHDVRAFMAEGWETVSDV